ncbi:MAG: DUF6259 domain-containing protein [Bacteroidales bacterium]|nr:DUF6259 domain-containing protein [Bacteroidales bacterium]
MKKHKNIIFCSVLLSIIVFLSSCRDNKTTDHNVYIDNGKITLGFDKSTGSLTCFKDLVNSYDWFDGNISDGSPWEIEFVNNKNIELIDIKTASGFRYSKPDASTLILKWKKFAGAENKNLEVEAKVTLDNEKALSSWKISVSNIKNRQIKQVIFPRIAGLKDPGEEILAVPAGMGQLLQNPRKVLAAGNASVKKYQWTYPDWFSLQCLALYNPEKCGFYASCNDSLAYLKSFSFTLDTLNSFVYKMHNLPSVDSTVTSYEPPYAAVIGSFKGDWITAAGIYREWGTGQSWTKESRLKNSYTPDWLEKTALWVWNRGKSGNVLVPATELKQRLGLPVSVFWHWWHGCSYDDGFPEYIPPREGKVSFLKAMSAANEKGINAIVYMNQRLWGTTTESWTKENALPYAVKNSDGKINTHVYNIFSNKGTASMCMGTQFWKDKYSSLCDSAINTYSANGVYMDQACAAMSCYDGNHGHPIGTGNYWVDNFGKLTRQIRSKISPRKQMMLAGEGCGESWIPYLDAFLTLDVSKERYAGLGGWETIPFFQAVYHQYAITYGNYSSLLVPPYDELWPKEYAPKKPLEMLSKDFNKQFLMEQARSFVWGMQPTIANYQSFLASERKEEIKFIMDLAKTRNQGLQYLLHGKFLKSPDIASPKEEFGISRLSIYAGKTGNTVTAFRGTFPLIYSGTWQSDNKQIGIAMASISDDPFNVNFNLNSRDYELPSSGKIFIINAEGKRLLASYSGEKIHIDFTLKPRDLCIVEITSE